VTAKGAAAVVDDGLDWASGDDGARDGKSETGPHVGFLFARKGEY
jgi:hypothetical protein